MILYLCLAALCLAAARPVEARLAAMRRTSGLAAYSGESARAGAAFVRCLGGLRGILADLIWMRALRMQDSGRYYEIVALLDGLLEMQPHFVSVWLFQAHVLAFDFGSPRVEPDPVEAFHWIERGIGVMERGIERNPTSALLEKRLAELYLYKLSPASPNPEWKLQAGLLNAQLSGREVPAGREPQELVRLMNRRLAELAVRDARPPAEPDNYTALRLARGHFLRAADKAKAPDAAGLKLLCQRFAIRCLERMGDWSTAESSWRSLFESQGRKDPNGFFREFMRSVVGELLLMGRTAESREAFGRLRGYFPEAEASYREFLAAEIRSDQAHRKTERAGQLYRALRAVEPGETRSYEEITGQAPPAEGTRPGPGRGN
jgi:hypothetical protein